MKESQLWLIVAAYYAAGRRGLFKNSLGICSTLMAVEADGFMSYQTREKMRLRMYQVFPRYAERYFNGEPEVIIEPTRGSAFFWSVGDVNSRLNACGLLSALAEEEGQ